MAYIGRIICGSILLGRILAVLSPSVAFALADTGTVDDGTRGLLIAAFEGSDTAIVGLICSLTGLGAPKDFFCWFGSNSIEVVCLIPWLFLSSGFKLIRLGTAPFFVYSFIAKSILSQEIRSDYLGMLFD